MDDVQKVKELIALMKAEKVDYIKLDGLEIKKSIHLMEDLTPKQTSEEIKAFNKKKEDADLFWSTNQ